MSIQKNGTGYFTDDCWSRDGRYISHNDSYQNSKIPDFRKMESSLLPGATLPHWRVKENTAVFLAGSTLRMLSMEHFPKLTVIADSVGEGEQMGNVDCNDEYVYGWATPEVSRVFEASRLRFRNCRISVLLKLLSQSVSQ